jgi:hypothetical protein
MPRSVSPEPLDKGASGMRDTGSREFSITLSAPLDCPSCGHQFTGQWTGREGTAQNCPSCGTAFMAAWPGWEFKPQTVIVHPEGQPPRTDPR